MSTARSARIELRVTPAQKQIIAQGAADRGMTLTEYSIGTLISAALRDTSSADPSCSGLGWMRGTAIINGDLVAPTEPDGWLPGIWPS